LIADWIVVPPPASNVVTRFFWQHKFQHLYILGVASTIFLDRVAAAVVTAAATHVTKFRSMTSERGFSYTSPLQSLMHVVTYEHEDIKQFPGQNSDHISCSHVTIIWSHNYRFASWCHFCHVCMDLPTDRCHHTENGISSWIVALLVFQCPFCMKRISLLEPLRPCYGPSAINQVAIIACTNIM